MSADIAEPVRTHVNTTPATRDRFIMGTSFCLKLRGHVPRVLACARPSRDVNEIKDHNNAFGCDISADWEVHPFLPMRKRSIARWTIAKIATMRASDSCG